MTISDVLERVSHPTGRAGRTSCPFCGGSSHATKFSYTADKWHCWGCGEGGGVSKLMELLGLEVEVKGFAKGLLNGYRGGWDGQRRGPFDDWGDRPSARLMRWLNEQTEEAHRRLAAAHRDGLAQLREIREVLAIVGRHPEWNMHELMLEWAGRAWQAAWTALAPLCRRFECYCREAI